MIEDRTCVLASMGGAAKNPPWYYNVVAHPDVTVEIGTETYRATAKVTEGADRDRLWAEVVRRMPVFGEYETRTNRTIPVIEPVRQAD